MLDVDRMGVAARVVLCLEHGHVVFGGEPPRGIQPRDP
jgi:hypothetical protein